MSKIIGSADVIQKAKELTATTGKSLINWELINQLPDQYCAQIVPVKFNIDTDFENVGTAKAPIYYPHIDFMYKLSTAAGIKGYGEVKIEPIMEEINISVMEMNETPVIMKRKVGFMVTKQAQILNEDGTYRQSSPRTAAENAWDYCEKIWTKEEEATNGYQDVQEDKYGNLQYFYIWNGEKKYKKVQYNTKYKRRKFFQDRLENTLGMADSKAWGKCIREVIGLQTGFKEEHLQDGILYVAKIRRSQESLKMETAARMTALSQGQSTEPNVLFADNQDENPKIKEAEKPESNNTPETAREMLIKTLKTYQENGLIIDDMKTIVPSIINWLIETPNAEEVTAFWTKAIDKLKIIDSKIPEEGRIDHLLY